MAGSDASEGQAVWQPGGAEEDSRLRVGNRHLHLAYDEEEEEEGHTTYLEATDRLDGEKQSAETILDEKARRNYLGCRLINSDPSLHSNSRINHGVCIHYVGNGC